jgi:Domain of unknown function (DUF4062)
VVTTEATELVIFVASPSDVQDERAAVKSVAERIESSLGLRLGLRIRVVGWEQVPPGYGRPQGQINPLVDTCDIFIGILHARWGTESGTHSSGFIEEYERAVARLGTSGRPAIAMFFKLVPQNQRDDAGPQLQRVLEFRERAQREHTLLYCDVPDTVDFERQLTNLLLYHVGEMTSNLSAPPDSPSGEPLGEPANVQVGVSGDSASTGAGSTQLTEAQAQLLGVLDSFTALIRRDPSRSHIDNDRLLLFACAVSNGPFIPTHEANRLYLRRPELVLTTGEAGHWLRSMAADWQRNREDRTIPGWAILGKGFIDESASSLLGDSETAVVVGGLGLMTSLGIRPSELWLNAPVEFDDPANLRVIERWQSLFANPATAAAAGAHLGTLAGTTDGPLLDELIVRILDDATRSTIRLIRNVLSGEFTGLAASIAGRRHVPQWQVSLLTVSLARIKKEDLKMLIATEVTPRNQALKRAAGIQLSARGEISEDVIAAALDSGDKETARLIVEAARQCNDSSEMFCSAINRLKAGGKDTNWRRSHTDIAPRILAAICAAEELEASMELDADAWEARQYQKGIDGAPAAREMLSMTENDWSGTLPEPLRAAIVGKDVISYVYARHIIAAIRYLSQLPTHSDEDLGLIRARISDAEWSINAEVADALTHVGTAADAKPLLDVVASANVIDRDRILRAALSLGGSNVIEEVVATADNATAAVTIPFLARLAEPVLKSLLRHSVAKIRIAASDELSRRLNREQLESLISEYVAPASYFYNVVVALDVALYAPSSTGPTPVQEGDAGVDAADVDAV